MVRSLFCLLFAVIFAIAAPCPASARPLVVATFSILGDMTRNIAGDLIELQVLVGPKTEPHGFEPGPGAARSIKKADLLIANGLGFEPWLDRLINNAEFKGRLVMATAAITPLTFTAFGRQLPDPHAWHDLELAQIYISNIADGLIAIDPGNAETYRTNLRRYSAALSAIDTRIKTSIGAIPVAQRRILTDHGAFAYFGAAYGIRFISVNGRNDDSELSAKSLRQLILEIRSAKIRTLFLEADTDPRLLRQIANETGARPGAELIADSLSPAGQPGDTYLGIFDANLPKLIEAMADQAP
jgi:zinc/manganese transport system substrate-binding protein